MIFYTYLWLRNNTPCPHCGQLGRPYYAGKGKGRRGFRTSGHRFPCPKNSECIIIQEWLDETSAFEGEKFLIAMYGRIDNGTGCLLNLTDGGDNPPNCAGIPKSEAHKAKISAANKGKKAFWNKGRPHTEISKAKLSAAQTAFQASRTCCGKGHPFNDKNTRQYKAKDGHTRRQCRICAAIEAKKWRDKHPGYHKRFTSAGREPRA